MAAALATGLVVSQVLPFLISIIAIGIGATCLYSHIKAKNEEEKWQKPENQKPLKGFHPVNFSDILQDKCAAYMGVGKRNEIGYKAMSVLGGIAIIGIIATGIIL